MLYTNFTEKLVVFQDLIITKVEENQKEIHIYGEIKRKPHKCPCCGGFTDKIHDYRETLFYEAQKSFYVIKVKLY